MLVHACILSTLEAKTGGLQIYIQPELHREALSQKHKTKQKE
jgi:hypothetical protein